MPDAVTPTDLLHAAQDAPFGSFSPGKTFTLGEERGKQKISSHSGIQKQSMGSE